MNHKVGMNDMEIDIDGDIVLYKALDHLLILLRILFFLTSEKCAYVMPHKSCHYGEWKRQVMVIPPPYEMKCHNLM